MIELNRRATHEARKRPSAAPPRSPGARPKPASPGHCACRRCSSLTVQARLRTQCQIPAGALHYSLAPQPEPGMPARSAPRRDHGVATSACSTLRSVTCEPEGKTSERVTPVGTPSAYLTCARARYVIRYVLDVSP